MKIFNQFTKSILFSTSLMSITEISFAAAAKVKGPEGCIEAVDAATYLQEFLVGGSGTQAQMDALALVTQYPTKLVLSNPFPYQNTLTLAVTGPALVESKPLTEIYDKLSSLVEMSAITPVINVSKRFSMAQLDEIVNSVASLAAELATPAGKLYAAAKIYSGAGAGFDLNLFRSANYQTLQGTLLGFGTYENFNSAALIQGANQARPLAFMNNFSLTMGSIAGYDSAASEANLRALVQSYRSNTGIDGGQVGQGAINKIGVGVLNDLLVNEDKPRFTRRNIETGGFGLKLPKLGNSGLPEGALKAVEGLRIPPGRSNMNFCPPVRVITLPTPYILQPR